MEILETIGNINYNTFRPRPLDPASLFDLVKVRCLVDEATNLAVRAASDIASPVLTNVHGGFGDPGSMGSLGSLGGGGHGAKLSRERRFRMREQASQKLARAYRLDEIACSVATMQGASPLEDVGSLVLQRSAKDSDARYVHFFHEKIPSRQLAESTSLQPLSEIIADRPAEPEVLRTRATIRVFKDDYEGAAQDLTHAISACRSHDPQRHAQIPAEPQAPGPQQARRRLQDVILSDKDRPSSLHGQLLFQRANVHLAMACRHVSPGLLPKDGRGASSSDDAAQATGADGDGADKVDAVASAASEASRRQADAQKMVKTLAKRALKDYMAFISQFEYSPNLPVGHVKDFSDRVNLAVQGARYPRMLESTTPTEPHTVHPLADLFAAVPPANLPPYPLGEAEKGDPSYPSGRPETHCELTTYHPLLADALHSLLLCHCLAQTSPKELQRHAYMVARLVRLSDGYPVFQASRSPSRSDWVEVLSRADNWLGLSADWDTLCAPAPIPTQASSPDDVDQTPDVNPELAASAAAALISGNSHDAATAGEMRRDHGRGQAVADALDDDRADVPSNGAPLVPPPHRPAQLTKRWSGEDARDSADLTERASAVALWVREAPVVTGTARRKKRPKNRAGATTDVESAVQRLEIADPVADKA